MKLNILLTNVLLVLEGCVVKAADIIGSEIGHHSSDYVPAEISPNTFFLNVNSSANTDGNISTITYCFFKPRDLSQNFYQATVGIYHLENGGNTYSLSNSFILTKTLTSLMNTNDTNDLLCEEISIQSIEVQAGDVFGVCQNVVSPSLFNLSLIKAGDINLIAKGEDAKGGGSLMSMAGVDSTCDSLGSVPKTVSSGNLQSQESFILLLSANINSMTECHPVTITKVGIATSVISLALVSILIFTSVILICATRCLRKKPQSMGVLYDEEESFSQVNYHKKERPSKLNTGTGRGLVHTTSPQYDYARTSPLIGSNSDLLQDLQEEASGSYNEVTHHYQCPDSETSVDAEDLDHSSSRFKLQKIGATSPKYDDPVPLQRNICYGTS